MKHGLTKLFREFFDSERTGGYLLIICTAVSLAIANSPLSSAYAALFKTKIGFDLASISMNYPVYIG